ncbi:MAG: CotH kinase family protein [Parabacteroides gordonii]|nr:CotH kinase family protein [Parabacteroides gordonii]
MIYIYINGVMSGVAQYPTDDNFQQATPVDILIGSNDCTIDLYNIRIYDNNLTEYQMLDNFIADIDDYDKKVEVYERNQVYDEYGNISYQKVLEKIPCMILEGPLPTFKGDKKTNKLYFTDLQSPARSFSCDKIENNVQGTSSQYYPRKNFKFKFKAPITYTESGDTSDNYALRADSIAVNCFCIKADFAESSSTHNAGMAKIIDNLLKDMDILTPPQQADKRVRTTVDGYPICLFHRETVDGELTFVGKYNFNNDKSTEATFGFTDGDESWEFSNNTSDRCLFKSADFSTDDWQNDFEGRYPDGSTDTTNFQAIMEWVVSTKDDPAKFRAEVSEHFDLDNLLIYYLITELFAMVDQRAKNMFLTRYHGDNKWRFIFYDNDTIAGINNEGLISFGYGVEYHDVEGSLNVFNGESSVLWNNVEAAFPDEIAAMYKNIRSKGYLSYDYVISILNGDESDKWCEAIYNADGRFKYVEPLIQDGNGSYLYACQGSRAEHRKWWLYNRFLYMDSKYTAGDFLSDFATMRLYTPQNWAGVEPNADFTIAPFADQYVMVKYGSYMVGQRGKKGVAVTIEAPDIVFNDTETIVYGASRVKSLGDLAGKYAGTVDMSRAIRLSDLHIGSDVEGYHNDNLTVLSIGTNKMLARLNIQNCPNLTQTIDLSSCDNIEEVYAQGASVSSIALPIAGILSKLYLPGTLTNLTLKNQPKLSDTFFLQYQESKGYQRLSMKTHQG